MNNAKTLNNILLILLIAFQMVPWGVILFNTYEVSQWNDTPGWLIDENTGCKVYTSRNFQYRAAVWEGDCENGLAHGYGTLTIHQGNLPLLQFEGILTNGVINGNGRMVALSDGDVYEGGFLDNKINGVGHYYNDDGDHYEGDYVNGVMEGFGTYWYEPDNPLFKYVGNWKRGNHDGEGILYFRDGKVMEGMFKDGAYLSNANGINEQEFESPKNILITNDDGVEDMDRLICLAEEMATFADHVVVAVSSDNKSGTSNRMSVTSQGFLESKSLLIDTFRNINIYEVKGFPADCIFLGASIFLAEYGVQPDLVISGINGGANSGAEWFGSGTVGAARTAALAKIPAIAISGINEDQHSSEGLGKICKWVSKLAQSDIVHHIKPLEYLTVSIPENLDKLKGVKIVERAITFQNAPFILKKSEDTKPKVGETNVWKLSLTNRTDVYNLNHPHDVTYYVQDYIVIVPMTVDENNHSSLYSYQQMEDRIPKLD